MEMPRAPAVGAEGEGIKTKLEEEAVHDGFQPVTIIRTGPPRAPNSPAFPLDSPQT